MRAWVLLMLALSPCAARAESIALLTFVSAGADAGALTAAARAAILDYTALDLVSIDALPFDRPANDVRRCAGRPACFVDLARGASVRFDRLLVLGLDHLGDEWTLSYRLIDAREPVTQRAVGVEVSHDAVPTIDALVSRALREALREHWGQAGRLSIRGTPAGAEATVERRSCVTPCVLSRVPSGSQSLELRAPGYISVRRDVVVRAGATTEVDIALEAEDSALDSPWLWVAVTAIASAGVVTAVLLASSGSGPLCFSPDEARCP